MFDLLEVFRLLNEQLDEAEKPEIISIEVFVEPVELAENIPSSSIQVYDEQTIEEWYDFASTVEGIIDNFCDLVNISLSKNDTSLSEYIDFYVYDSEGNKKNYLIDLRLSTHGATQGARETRKRHVKKIDTNYELHSIIVNDKTFNSYNDAISYVRKLLAEKSMKD